MQMIAIIESLSERFGIRSVLRRLIKIHDGVESASGADPSVHGLSYFLAFVAVIESPFIRRQCAAGNLNSVRMGTLDHLLHGSDEFLGGDRIWRWGVSSSARSLADVVDALQNHYPLHARHSEHIAIESRQGIYAGAISEEPIPRDTLIENSHLRSAGCCENTSRKCAGPTAIGVICRSGAICDGVTKSHDGSGIYGTHDVDSRDPIIRTCGNRVFVERRIRGHVTFCDV